MKPVRSIALLVIILFALAVPDSILQHQGAAQTFRETRGQAIRRLQDSLAGRGRVKQDRATGFIDFVKLNQDASGSLANATTGATTRRGKSLAFFREHEEAFGLTDADSQLTLAKEERDPQGGVHLTFNQTYKGVPVFAGVLKTHFDPAGDLRAVNGVVVPAIELNPNPSRTSEEAAAVALAKVKGDSPQASWLTTKESKLYIYRAGLGQGVAGQNHLAWEIEVSNSADIREFVYIDAHSGKFIDQLTGIYDALDRRVYDGENILQYPPPSYPSSPFWVEGQQFPTGVADADEIIAATRETYDLFHNALGRDSFDNAGSTMDSIFNSGVEPGNAHADPLGQLTGFGEYFVTDDVVGHEWTHIYTYFTNGLIYAWQPGALNEAYSDIIGETIDLLNGRGLDSPGGLRQNDGCAYLVPSPVLHVNSPSYLQRDYTVGPALFGPPFSAAGVTGNIVIVNDGVGSRSDGCQTPFRNALQIRGNIALIDRSQPETSACGYAQRVKNAQLNGAVAVLIANDAAAGDIPAAMYDFDPSITIPSGRIGYSDGQALRDPRARNVNGTIRGGEEVGNSQRWQLGEETVIKGFRDMWNPRCYDNPAKTSDRQYFCGTLDNGGVHLNSGVPNHAYALLVDGGTFNGQSIQPLGLTKAAHIYLRAMVLYHTPTSDFADHAEALEASAADLVGVNLPDLLTGLPSGQVISAADLEQVHKATLAVELRDPPSQCGFQPLLAKNPPADGCPAPQNTEVTLFSDGFESDPTSRWVISSEPSSPATFLPRDWTWVHQLPDGRPGSGFFAIDPLDDCLSALPGQVGVLHLESPAISLPRVMLGSPHLSFDHWVATESRFDGGQLMISVNDGPFILVAPTAFLYNGYNTTLFPAPPGFEDQLSPRAGQPAFSGADGGILKGSWGTSIIDLTFYARSGDRIKLRWDLSTDYCYGTNLGWYVDNVRVYGCRL